jgi:uncharacterized protein YukE
MEGTAHDPAEIRRQAALLRSAAETIELLVQRLDHRVESMTFEGPAAVRFKAAMHDRRQRGNRVANELEELATRFPR